MKNQIDILESYLCKYLARTLKQANSDLLDFDILMDYLPEEKRLHVMSCAVATKELIIERLEKRFAKVSKNSYNKNS